MQAIRDGWSSTNAWAHARANPICHATRVGSSLSAASGISSALAPSSTTASQVTPLRDAQTSRTFETQKHFLATTGILPAYAWAPSGHSSSFQLQPIGESLRSPVNDTPHAATSNAIPHGSAAAPGTSFVRGTPVGSCEWHQGACDAPDSSQSFAASKAPRAQSPQFQSVTGMTRTQLSPTGRQLTHLQTHMGQQPAKKYAWNPAAHRQASANMPIQKDLEQVQLGQCCDRSLERHQNQDQEEHNSILARLARQVQKHRSFAQLPRTGLSGSNSAASLHAPCPPSIFACEPSGSTRNPEACKPETLPWAASSLFRVMKPPLLQGVVSASQPASAMPMAEPGMHVTTPSTPLARIQRNSSCQQVVDRFLFERSQENPAGDNADAMGESGRLRWQSVSAAVFAETADERRPEFGPRRLDSRCSHSEEKKREEHHLKCSESDSQSTAADTSLVAGSGCSSSSSSSSSSCTGTMAMIQSKTSRLTLPSAALRARGSNTKELPVEFRPRPVSPLNSCTFPCPASPLNSCGASPGRSSRTPNARTTPARMARVSSASPVTSHRGMAAAASRRGASGDPRRRSPSVTPAASGWSFCSPATACSSPCQQFTTPGSPLRLRRLSSMPTQGPAEADERPRSASADGRRSRSVIQCAEVENYNRLEDELMGNSITPSLIVAALSKVVPADQAKHPHRAAGGSMLLQQVMGALGCASSTQGTAEEGRAQECEAVQQLFLDSIPEWAIEIESVHQVLQPQLLKRFLERVAADGESIEVTFHGTRSEHIGQILQEGLNPNVCATAAYGRGAYVATHAGIAHQYADPDENGRRHMCVALAAVGSKLVKGKEREQQFAVAADRVVNPTQYCFIEEDRLYVSHLITYRAAAIEFQRTGGGFEDPFHAKLNAALRSADARRRHGRCSTSAL
eukprot:TRINITY_DN14276_c0_g2_i1.p1 TRINITY_DN14276_c0_g2~~TRINITY_DN14276_c0_g2_i1.p1  ORF type:complete len:913 (-),score=119.37 TRINITY_DN14276_c0_g2_i1:239-2977(-)